MAIIVNVHYPLDLCVLRVSAVKNNFENSSKKDDKF